MCIDLNGFSNAGAGSFPTAYSDLIRFMYHNVKILGNQVKHALTNSIWKPPEYTNILFMNVLPNLIYLPAKPISEMLQNAKKCRTLYSRRYLGKTSISGAKPDTTRLSSPPFISCHAQSFQPRSEYGSVKSSSSSCSSPLSFLSALHTPHSFKTLLHASIKCSRRWV